MASEAAAAAAVRQTRTHRPGYLGRLRREVRPAVEQGLRAELALLQLMVAEAAAAVGQRVPQPAYTPAAETRPVPPLACTASVQARPVTLQACMLAARCTAVAEARQVRVPTCMLVAQVQCTAASLA